MGRRLSLMSIAVANLLGAVEYSIVMPSLYGYLNTFGETQDWFFGLVLSSFQLSQLLTSSLFGLWIDKRPMREVIIAAIAFSILGNMLYVFSWSHWMVLVSRAISGIGGNVVVASNTYVVRATPPERRSAVAAKVFSFSNLGLLAGPAFNFVLAFFNWEIGPIKIDPLNGAGLLMSALLVAGLIFILSCFEEPSKTHSAEHGETKQELTKSEKYKELIKPAVITIFVADFILAFNQTCLETFLTPLTKKYWGWEQFQNSLLYSGLTILFVFWFVSITFLSRVLQDRALILIGMC
jgi:MFS family permease